MASGSIAAETHLPMSASGSRHTETRRSAIGKAKHNVPQRMQGAKSYRLISNLTGKAADAAIYIRPNLGRIRRSMQPWRS